MKILLLFFLVTSYMQITSAFASDPCTNDPACFKVDNTQFDNPYHFIFVGAYPSDELLMYPLLKDHCSETNNYCAMIIATHGESECEFSTGEVCGNIRATELQESAKYLNTDLWHYDLPSGNEISPNSISAIRDTYNNIAQVSGFIDVSDYFKYILQELQFSNTKPLVVISLHPFQGSINHPEDKIVKVLDEFISSAVEQLQENNINIAHYYADSQLENDQLPFISRHDDFFIECRKGNAHLLRTNTHLTNYEIFEQGYYDIYPSQTFHLGEVSNNTGDYEFCFDNTIQYFNTARPEKLMGFSVTEPNQLNDIKSFSNAFSFTPLQPSDITDYLNQNANKLLPIIEIGRFFFDETLQIFNYSDVAPIVQAIEASSHHGPILFLIDEPLWHIRFGCLKGISTACEEINNDYSNTLSIFKKTGRDLRKALPEAGMIHIEAFAELNYQKATNPSGTIILLDDVEYLGFDCYGAFDNCGVIDISEAFVEANVSEIASEFRNDYFSATSLFKITDPDIKDAIFTAGVSQALAPGDVLGIICDRIDSLCVTVSLASLPSRPQTTYIEWVLELIQSLEARNSIGRKAFLVAGAFQDFNSFSSETKAIDQINAFVQTLDSSTIFGGLGGFVWGDIQESFFPFIGGRSLSSVRSVVADAFRARILENTILELPPSMSLVGAIGKRGGFNKVPTNGATQGELYFQNAGMDSCSITVSNEPSQIMKLDQLNYIAIPDLITPLDVEAECFKENQSFVKTLQFIN